MSRLTLLKRSWWYTSAFEILLSAVLMSAGCDRCAEPKPPVTALPQYPEALKNQLSLHDAIREGDIAALDAYLKDSADPDTKNHIGAAPLHTASRFDRPEAIRLLLAYGADANMRDRNGWLPLHLAAIYIRTEIPETLLIATADLNALNGQGESPLHLAAQEGPDTTVRALLETGADPHLVNGRGETPLHIAARRGRAPILVHLLIHGADPTRLSLSGHTSIDLALASGDAQSLVALGCLPNRLPSVSEVEYMLKAAAETIERRVDLPQRDYEVQVSESYESMIRQAPVVDLQAAGFHRGNAKCWQTAVGESFVASLSGVSPGCEAIIRKAVRHLKVAQDAPEHNLRKVLGEVDKVSPSESSDRFVVAYLRDYLRDFIRVAEIASHMNSALLSGGTASSEDYERISKTFLAHARELESITYDPVIQLQETTIREAMSVVLRDLARRAEGIDSTAQLATRLPPDLRAKVKAKVQHSLSQVPLSLKLTFGISLFDEVRVGNPALNENQLFEVASILGNAIGVNAKYFMFYKNGLPEEGRVVMNPGFDYRDTSDNIPD